MIRAVTVFLLNKNIIKLIHIKEKQDLVNYLLCTSDNGMWKNNNRFPRLVKVMSCLIKTIGSFHALQKFPRHNLVSAFYILFIWFMLTLQVLCPTDPSFVFRTCLQNKCNYHTQWLAKQFVPCQFN